MEQKPIQVKSGNTYYCAACEIGIDVCSERFGSERDLEPKKHVTINRVNYFARAVVNPFSALSVRRWNPTYFDVTCYRAGSFDDPTDSARAKLRAEMLEAATIYNARHWHYMLKGYADSLKDRRDRQIQEAEGLEAKASDIRADCSALSREEHETRERIKSDLERRNFPRSAERNEP